MVHKAVTMLDTAEQVNVDFAWKTSHRYRFFRA